MEFPIRLLESGPAAGAFAAGYFGKLTGHEHVTYPPLNTLKRIAGDLWIVDGPAIPFGPSIFKNEPHAPDAGSLS